MWTAMGTIRRTGEITFISSRSEYSDECGRELLTGAEVFDFQLDVSVAVVFVDAWLHGEVDLHAALELVAPLAVIEGDAAHEGAVLLHLYLHVVTVFADAAGCAGDFDGLAKKLGLGVAGAEGAETV